MIIEGKDGYTVTIIKINDKTWQVSRDKEDEPHFLYCDEAKAYAKFKELSGKSIEEC
jgi:hypothetical protein